MRKPVIAAVIAFAFALPLAGCKDEGPMEKAGKKMDEAAEEMEEAVEDMDDE